MTASISLIPERSYTDRMLPVGALGIEDEPFDEDAEARRQIRQALALPGRQRLAALSDSYSLFVTAHRRRGGEVIGAGGSTGAR